MTFAHIKTISLALLFLVLGQCGSLERDNPLDPGGRYHAAATRPDQGPQGLSTLRLYLPLPKALLSVVDSVVATLEGPDIPPVVKELSISPLGPATGILGALQPGRDRTLTVAGYDLESHLLFTGQRTGITILAGDTTSVELLLRLTQPLPSAEGSAAAGAGPAPSDQSGAGTSSGEDGGADQAGSEAEADSGTAAGAG